MKVTAIRVNVTNLGTWNGVYVFEGERAYDAYDFKAQLERLAEMIAGLRGDTTPMPVVTLDEVLDFDA